MNETGPAHSWLPDFLRTRKKQEQASPGDASPDEVSSLLPKSANAFPDADSQETGETYSIEDQAKNGSRLVLD